MQFKFIATIEKRAIEFQTAINLVTLFAFLLLLYDTSGQKELNRIFLKKNGTVWKRLGLNKCNN